MLLPVIKLSKSTHKIEDSNPKSIKNGWGVEKLYNFKNWNFINKIIIVNPTA